MIKAKRIIQKGFTLIELLIVVVIIAILAAIVIPQFGSTSSEAKESTLDANLAAMRTAIELYKIQHNNVTPGAAASTGTDMTGCAAGAPAGGGVGGTEEAMKVQLTYPTNAAGVACKVAQGTFIYGPYLKTKFPADPLKNSDKVTMQTTGAALAPAALDASGNDTGPGGWLYDTKSGQFIMNSAALDSKGKAFSTR